jgi:hypothetical protein
MDKGQMLAPEEAARLMCVSLRATTPLGGSRKRPLYGDTGRQALCLPRAVNCRNLLEQDRASLSQFFSSAIFI